MSSTYVGDTHIYLFSTAISIDSSIIVAGGYDNTCNPPF